MLLNSNKKLYIYGMSEENKPHEPVLLSEDHREEKVKPPYLLIVLVLFGVLGAFWKMVVHKDEQVSIADIAPKSNDSK